MYALLFYKGNWFCHCLQHAIELMSDGHVDDWHNVEQMQVERPCVPNEIRTFLQPDISPIFVFQTPDNSPFVRRFVQVRILINGELSGPAKLRTENCPPVQNSRTEKRPDGGFVRTPCPTTRAAFSTTDLHSDQTISAGVGGQGAIYIKHLTEKLKLR